MISAIAAATMLASFFLRDHDRVAWFGDSITERATYTNFVEAAVRTRYPALDIKYFNVGWAGDTTWGSSGWDGAPGGPEERVARDIAPLHPTVITSMLGMNDAGYVPWDAKIDDTFREWYGKLLDECKRAAPAARVVLFSTSPWDDFARPPAFFEGIEGVGGYNAVLAQYARTVHALAERRQLDYVEVNAPVAHDIAAAAKLDPKAALDLIPDRIHPDEGAGMLVGTAILRAWNFEPVVTTVRIDASSNRVVSTRTKATSVGHLAWDQLDESLPLPVDQTNKGIALAYRASDDFRGLNREVLEVDHLEPGTYHLIIDGQKITAASADEFARGIDLATLLTPMLRQSLDLYTLVQKKKHLDFVRWRDVGISFAKRRTTPAAVRALQQLIDELDANLSRMAAPQVHHYRLEKE